MNGIKYLLDTNIIIGLCEHNPATLNLLKAKNIKISECAYSSITRMELLSYPAITPMDKQAIESLLVRMTYLAITEDIENETIQFRLGNKAKLPDSIIAATAKHYQLELLTEGSRYFCESLFWASQPKQAAKITRPPMPAAAPAVLLLSFYTQQGV